MKSEVTYEYLFYSVRSVALIASTSSNVFKNANKVYETKTALSTTASYIICYLLYYKTQGDFLIVGFKLRWYIRNKY